MIDVIVICIIRICILSIEWKFLVKDVINIYFNVKVVFEVIINCCVRNNIVIKFY